MTGAFGGNPACKSEVMARLDKALAAGHVVAETATWNPPTGSPSGVVAESVDLKEFERRTGIPAAMGLLIDGLALMHSMDPAAHAAFVRQCFAVIRPGADVAAAGTRFLLGMYDDPCIPGVVDKDAEVEQLLAEARRLQSGELAGRESERAEWSALRARALALADARSGLVSGVVDLVERTAWPLRGSRGALADGVYTLAALASSVAVAQSGWTRADQQRVDETLGALEAEAKACGQTQPNYQQLFAARAPELERRFREQMQTHATTTSALASLLGKRLVAVLEGA